MEATITTSITTSAERDEAIAVLEHFRGLVEAYSAAEFNVLPSEADIEETARLRREILQQAPRVRAIMGRDFPRFRYQRAGQPVTFDSLQSLFDPRAPDQSRMATSICTTVEEAIGALKYPAPVRVATPPTPVATAVDRVVALCRRFPEVARQLRRRRKGRPAFDLEDEAAVQDLLHALLRVDFDDVQDEAVTPTDLGGSARIDFLLASDQIGIEVKFATEVLGERKLGDELAADILRYEAHPDCRVLVCFVYDGGHVIKNAAGFARSLESKSNGRLRVVAVIAQG